MIMKKIFTLIAVLGCALGIQAQDTWTVAGEKSIVGVSWDPADATNDMASTDGVNFTLVKTGMMVKAKSEGGYGFKVVKNHSWDEAYGAEGGGDNALLAITEDGEYTITFSFNADTKIPSAEATKTGEYVTPTEEQTWTVAGSTALCGTSWDPANTANDMTSTDGVNYTLVKEDVVIEAGVTVQLKVCADHAWDEAYPSNNYEFTVDATGKYKVTIKFNKDSKEVNHEAVKTGEAELTEKIWTIAGQAAILGSDWNKDDESNDMTDMNDGTFQLVKKAVTVDAGSYTYKVLANHSWDENYGDPDSGDKDGNAILVIEAAGTYDITFVFNPESKELYATADEATVGINTVKLSNNDNTVMFNLQGQRVTNSFRGIAIRNGRKMIVK
jgi:hypothetical protein